MISTDVLVIGGGIAAAAAAIEAARNSAQVLLLDKGKFGRSGSSLTSGGGLALLLPADFGGHPEDNESVFRRDAVVGGGYLNDQRAIEPLCLDGPDCLRDLEDIGIRFNKDAANKYVTHRVLGQTFPRSVQPNPPSGSVVTAAMRKAALALGVQVIENAMVVRLLGSRDGVKGALALHRKTGETIAIQAKATILAAGSATALFPYASASLTTTGDAYALAYEVEAELSNMEFIEFTVVPVSQDNPIATGGIKPATAAGARWHNALGERFMQRYDPEMLELTNRAMMVQANLLERRAGRGPVYLDFSHIPRERLRVLEERDRHFLPSLRAAGIDYWVEPVECSPAVHAFLGGVRVNDQGATSIPGLYAVGEAAGFAGMFGADRAGSAIMACVVSGKRAGRSAATCTGEALAGDLGKDEVRTAVARLAETQGAEGDDPIIARRCVQEVAWKHLNAVRDGAGLRKAIDEFVEARRRRLAARDTREVVSALEVRNLALAGEMVARSALAREESRGQHLREDFPYTDNVKWLKWVTCQREEGEMKLGTVDVPIADYPLQPARERRPHPALLAAAAG